MRKIIQNLKRYQKIISQWEEELKQSPPGYLYLREHKTKKSYYHIVGNKEINITNNFAAINQLARKNILPYLINQRKSNLKIIIHNLTYPDNQKPLDRQFPEAFIPLMARSYRTLTIPYFWHPSIFPLNKETTPSSTYHPEQLKYKNNDGIMCRSKSERDASNVYSSMNLPYRYESPFYYNDIKYIPDFTVSNPWTLETFMHEHFGALHLEGYAQNKMDKIRTYRQAGFINLETIIYTYEEDLEDLENFKEMIMEVIFQL